MIARHEFRIQEQSGRRDNPIRHIGDSIAGNLLDSLGHR